MAGFDFSSVSNWFKKPDNLKGFGTVLSGGADIYGGIRQAKAAERMIDLEEDKYNFNKMLLLQDEEERRKAQANYDAATTGVIAL